MDLYLLISVCEREIMTEEFGSYTEAKEQRDKEMLEACLGDEEELREALENETEYESGGSFGFDEWRAYVNGHDNWDWAIVPVACLLPIYDEFPDE